MMRAFQPSAVLRRPGSRSQSVERWSNKPYQIFGAKNSNQHSTDLTVTHRFSYTLFGESGTLSSSKNTTILRLDTHINFSIRRVGQVHRTKQTKDVFRVVWFSPTRPGFKSRHGNFCAPKNSSNRVIGNSNILWNL